MTAKPASAGFTSVDAEQNLKSKPGGFRNRGKASKPAPSRQQETVDTFDGFGADIGNDTIDHPAEAPAMQEARPIANFAERQDPTSWAPRKPGRPEFSDQKLKDNERRRQLFSDLLRTLRAGNGLSISELGRRAGLPSPGQARSYESKCYPPGKVIMEYADTLNVTRHDLALALISASDPELYQCLTGKTGMAPLFERVLGEPTDLS